MSDALLLKSVRTSNCIEDRLNMTDGNLDLIMRHRVSPQGIEANDAADNASADLNNNSNRLVWDYAADLATRSSKRKSLAFLSQQNLVNSINNNSTSVCNSACLCSVSLSTPMSEDGSQFTMANSVSTTEVYTWPSYLNKEFDSSEYSGDQGISPTIRTSFIASPELGSLLLPKDMLKLGNTLQTRDEIKNSCSHSPSSSLNAETAKFIPDYSDPISLTLVDENTPRLKVEQPTVAGVVMESAASIPELTSTLVEEYEGEELPEDEEPCSISKHGDEPEEVFDKLLETKSAQINFKSTCSYMTLTENDVTSPTSCAYEPKRAVEYYDEELPTIGKLPAHLSTDANAILFEHIAHTMDSAVDYCKEIYLREVSKRDQPHNEIDELNSYRKFVHLINAKLDSITKFIEKINLETNREPSLPASNVNIPNKTQKPCLDDEKRHRSTRRQPIAKRRIDLDKKTTVVTANPRVDKKCSFADTSLAWIKCGSDTTISVTTDASPDRIKLKYDLQHAFQTRMSGFIERSQARLASIDRASHVKCKNVDDKNQTKGSAKRRNMAGLELAKKQLAFYNRIAYGNKVKDELLGKSCFYGTRRVFFD